jgi:serine protease
MKKASLLTACLMACLGLAGCDVELSLVPGLGAGVGGACQAPAEAEAAFLPPSDGAALQPLDGEENEDGGARRYVVHFEREPGYASMVSAAAAVKLQHRTDRVERAGGRVLRRFDHQSAVAAELTREQAATLVDDPEVRRVEEDPRRYLFAQSVPYGVGQVGAPSAWSLMGGGLSRGVRTCIIDSGLYAPHEDLPSSGVGGHPADWNKDSCGHGSHVAGTVAALDNDVGVVGVSPGADLFVVKVFGDDCGWSYASELADAVRRCADADAKVVNMSLGGRTPSELERDAFEAAWAKGLLLVAAAGNSGSTELQYPASYPSVLSVGAVDKDREVAPFSQRNGQVDLVAPGVRVDSTVGFTSRHEVNLPTGALKGGPIEHASPTSGASGVLVDGGRCDRTGNWSGRVVACERGGNTFAEKLDRVLRSGGAAAVVYNNEPGPFSGTLGDARVSLPAVAIPGADKAALLGAVGQRVTVFNELARPGNGYAAYSGTSMASPHVAGVASLIWGQAPARSNADVRRALLDTAQDLGAKGRDDLYGHGHVRADAALRHLLEHPRGDLSPEPGYFARCSGLSCTLYDTSFDGDGDLARREFVLDGVRLEGGRKARHTFSRPGPHRVVVEATDGRGAQSSYTEELDVLTLTASGSGSLRSGGRDIALRWSGSGASRVAVVRDGKLVGYAKNSGEVVDRLAKVNGGTLRYRVCNGALSSCSNEVSVAPLCG